MGDTSGTGLGRDFVTYDTLGLRTLTFAEQTLVTAGATGDNVRSAAGANGITGAKTFNSLLVGAGTTYATPTTSATTITGDGSSLFLTSGALANVATGATGSSTLTNFSSIIFGTTGANEAILTNENTTPGGTLTINSPIDTSSSLGGLTKTGSGLVVLGGANLYTGVTTVNQGTLQIGNGTTGSLAGSGSSGAVTVVPGATLALNQGTGSTFANNIVGNGTLTITIPASGTETISGAISGTTGITQSTAGTTLNLAGNNSYSGAESVSAGTLVSSGNNSNSGVTTVSGTGILQGVANGSNTTGVVSTALSPNSFLILNSASTSVPPVLQLRADSNTTFTTGTATVGGNLANVELTGSTTGAVVTIDVNQAATGSGNVLTLGTVLTASTVGGGGNETLNVTGGNGDSLAIGAIVSSNTATDSGIIFNPTTANLTVGSITTSSGKSSTVGFSGSGNTTVLGSINVTANGGGVFTFGQTGTVTLDGTAAGTVNGYTFNNGTTVFNITGATKMNNAGTYEIGSTTATGNNVNFLLGGSTGTNGGVTQAVPFTIGDPDTGLVTIGGQNTSGINTNSGTLKLGTSTNKGKTINLVAGTGGEMDFTGVISNNGTDTTAGTTVNSSYTVNGATVNPTGLVKLNALNTYAGPTTVNAGTLSLARAGTITTNASPGVITAGTLAGASALVVNSGGTLLLGANQSANPASTVTLSSGTFSIAAGVLQGRGETVASGAASTATATSNTVGLGALTLTASSTLSFAGTSGTVVFSSFDPTNNGAGTFTLNVTGTNFGTATTSADGSTDRLIFDQDLSNVGGVNYLNDITFNGNAGTTEMSLGGGFYEVIAAVPEPSTYLGGLLMLGATVYGFRGRLGRRVA